MHLVKLADDQPLIYQKINLAPQWKNSLWPISVECKLSSLVVTALEVETTSTLSVWDWPVKSAMTIEWSWPCLLVWLYIIHLIKTWRINVTSEALSNFMLPFHLHWLKGIFRDPLIRSTLFFTILILLYILKELSFSNLTSIGFLQKQNILDKTGRPVHFLNFYVLT